MKFEFRMLNDILAKTIIVKAGSFDAVTHERFLMMAVIHGVVKINWGRLLFNLLKDMMTPCSKQARGFAVEICIILKGAPDLELGESKAFPLLKILTPNTIGTYIAKNKSINAEEVLEVPVEKVVKKAATKRRPAPADEPIAKKKRTTVGRAAPTEKSLELVPVVIRETAEIENVETDLEEPVVMEIAGTEPFETESRIDVSAITNYDEEEPLVETEKEKEKETEKRAKKIDSTTQSL
ncbi:fumarate hydratase class I (ISS) [Dorcoceras hygrometricum]|uniref:Fumarate hydratase class I (ISS) n=1 Tax=Dorcoceras hygrometricum TaxID=472368 RepID=A0A2Z7C039_9LAMI|nr:fumarate hydratase class I (ISS) [Dorcoceras hygrometricum]